MAHGVLGEHRKTERVHELGDSVVDLTVVVVGSASKHDAVRMVVLDPLEGLLAGLVDGVMEAVGLGPCGVNGVGDLVLRDARTLEATDASLGVVPALAVNQLKDAAFELIDVVVGHKVVHELDVALLELVDVELERRGVAHDDGAVVAVARALVLLALPAHAGHPDEVDVAVDEIHDVAVGELGWVTHRLARHGLDACLVSRLGRGAGEHHGEAQLGEHLVPEGIVLVHAERARDADGAARGGLYRQALAVEEQGVLLLEEVGGVRAGLLVTGAALATVARDEAPAAAEVGDGEQAAVGAQAAAGGLVSHLEIVNLILGKQRGSALGAGTVARKKRGAVATHAARDVGTEGILAREQLKRAQHSVVQERAALHDDLVANFLGVADLDNLEQGVLHDRVGKAGGDVAHRGAFLLGLLHARVHKDRAAASQVHGVLGREGSGGEVLHRHTHGVGKGADKRAATRRAGLVEHDVLDDTVLHAQALHVLAAHVEDELNAGKHLVGAAQVRDGLDLAGVGMERLDKQALAVARAGDVAHGATLRQRVVEIVHEDAGRAEDVALVGAVPGAQQLTVLADDGTLHSGGTSIDTDKDTTAIAGKVAMRDDLGAMTCVKLGLVGRGGEERVESLNLAALDVAQRVELLDEDRQARQLARNCRQSGAAGHEQVGVGRADHMLVIEVECHTEALAQLGEVLQGAAQEGDVTADGTAACKTGDGLRHDRLEDGGSHVLGLGTLVEQGLHVGLGENAATAGDGVDDGGALGHLIEAGGVGVQQRRHLVDEGTRAASARAVHALLDAVVEVNDLGVLAAQLDDDVGLGLEGLNRRLGGDDLLHELKAQPLRQEQTARTSDGDLETCVAKDLARGAEERLHGGAHVGMVALVAGIDELCVFVENGKLYRGGTHVDAQTQLAARPVKARTGRDLDGSLRLGKRRSLRSLACSLARRGHLSVNLTLGRAVASTSPGKRRLEVTLNGFALVFVGHGRLSPHAVQKPRRTASSVCLLNFERFSISHTGDDLYRPQTKTGEAVKKNSYQRKEGAPTPAGPRTEDFGVSGRKCFALRPTPRLHCGGRLRGTFFPARLPCWYKTQKDPAHQVREVFEN